MIFHGNPVDRRWRRAAINASAFGLLFSMVLAWGPIDTGMQTAEAATRNLWIYKGFQPSSFWDGGIEILQANFGGFRPQYHNERTAFKVSNDIYYEVVEKSREIRAAWDKVSTGGKPEPGYFLLHRHKGWDWSTLDPVPVLLVHGAMQTGQDWIHTYGSGYWGFSSFLYYYYNKKVFAVTFSHSHGDNYNQAAELAAAIDRVKYLTGSDKVDVISWSKGSIPARLYLSNVATWDGRGSFVPLYDNEVRKYASVAGPNLGIDFNFRHPYNDYQLVTLDPASQGANGPLAWTDVNRTLATSSDIGAGDIGNLTIYSACYPGQHQIAYPHTEYNVDDPSILDIPEQDWKFLGILQDKYFGGYTINTADRLKLRHINFYGGDYTASADGYSPQYFFTSGGIAAAQAIDGSLIDRMRYKKVLSDQTYIIYGTSQNSLPGIFPEKDGPSDAVLFENSAANSDWVDNLTGIRSIYANHIEILSGMAFSGYNGDDYRPSAYFYSWWEPLYVIAQMLYY